ncbi:hypothetical protein P3X46_000456 [Hevea brasiliensis]|uniref:CASP-like protein n=1 Tax=Hevea brasiliensis TaxID=3981 RepID=A0ABQ9NBE8_HEVBR|nr:hypothetical protein P3X46_000456 [Hevea brasiliensis]
MAKNTGVLICLLIMAMDIVASILGIEAEVAQNKVKHLKMWIFECRDPTYQAFKLGLSAAILMALGSFGFSMLIIGAMSNSKSRKSCILCFIHGLFIVGYYVPATAAAKDERAKSPCLSKFFLIYPIFSCLFPCCLICFVTLKSLCRKAVCLRHIC